MSDDEAAELRKLAIELSEAADKLAAGIRHADDENDVERSRLKLEGAAFRALFALRAGGLRAVSIAERLNGGAS